MVQKLPINTSWPRQEKLFIWPPFFQYPFFQYNKRLLRQKTGGAACFYMPQEPGCGWPLASQFWSYTTPQKVRFSAARKWKFPIETCCFGYPKFWQFLFLGRNFVTPLSTLANITGTLPTNSTTPDRLRQRTRTDGEGFILGFRVQTSAKQKYFQRSPIY